MTVSLNFIHSDDGKRYHGALGVGESELQFLRAAAGGKDFVSKDDVDIFARANPTWANRVDPNKVASGLDVFEQLQSRPSTTSQPSVNITFGELKELLPELALQVGKLGGELKPKENEKVPVSLLERGLGKLEPSHWERWIAERLLTEHRIESASPTTVAVRSSNAVPEQLKPSILSFIDQLESAFDAAIKWRGANAANNALGILVGAGALVGMITGPPAIAIVGIINGIETFDINPGLLILTGPVCGALAALPPGSLLHRGIRSQKLEIRNIKGLEQAVASATSLVQKALLVEMVPVWLTKLDNCQVLGTEVRDRLSFIVDRLRDGLSEEDIGAANRLIAVSAAFRNRNTPLSKADTETLSRALEALTLAEWQNVAPAISRAWFKANKTPRIRFDDFEAMIELQQLLLHYRPPSHRRNRLSR